MEQLFYFNDPKESQEILGRDPELLQAMESVFNAKVTARDTWLKAESSDAEQLKTLGEFVEFLRRSRAKGATLPKQGVLYVMQQFSSGNRDAIQSLHSKHISVSGPRKQLFARTLGQLSYIQAMQTHDICFGVGPAGTGKTYLAMAMAVSQLLEGSVHRILLTRPAVEAGESLGFLPGDLYQKVQPYLKPLYDALHDMMDADIIERHMERGVIEVAPLAYMRGRTLNNAFIILDEAQNTTPEQMLMFLTRMGFDSRMVVTGDPSQIDLPGNKRSGLAEALDAVKTIPGVAVSRLSEKDVVRHELVQKIIRSYQALRNQKE